MASVTFRSQTVDITEAGSVVDSDGRIALGRKFLFVRREDGMALAVGGDTATPKNLSLRLGLMRQHIAPGDIVLDVGCGRGEYLRRMIGVCADALGIETAAEKLADCRHAHPELSGRIFDVSAEEMPFADGYFDVVIVNEVLEHIADQDAALREIYRVLKPGGKFLLFCPNRQFPFETHGLRIRGVKRMWVPALHYLPARLCEWFGVEAVARNYWPGEIAKTLRQYGFVVQMRGFVQQTFENISGAQPGAVRLVKPVLRTGVRMMGSVPGLRGFVSVSSFLVATRAGAESMGRPKEAAVA
jgi:ubiquinone/menaquinone biosynthesis C-methylase UbiE